MSLQEQAQNVSRLYVRGTQMNYTGMQELQSLYKKKAELDTYILYKEKQLNYPYYSQGVGNQLNVPPMNHAQLHQLNHIMMQMQIAPVEQAVVVETPVETKTPLDIAVNLPTDVSLEDTTEDTTGDTLTIDLPENEEVSIVMDDTYVREVSYAQALMKNVDEGDLAKEEINYTPLFQKQCSLCWNKKKLATCKNYFKAHVGDLNWDFASLPYINRCLRSHCLDMNCKRYHHALTKRVSTRCRNKNCSCPNYVHPHDKPDNKPYFWKSYQESIDKPPKEIIDSYFLLKKKT